MKYYISSKLLPALHNAKVKNTAIFNQKNIGINSRYKLPIFVIL